MGDSFGAGWPERGTLNAGSIGSHKLTQDWTLDQVGNWAGFKQDLPTWPRPVGQAGAAGNRIGGPKPNVEAATRQVGPVWTKGRSTP